MQSRIDYMKVFPNAVKAMMGLQTYVNAAREHFSEGELVDLTLAIVAING